MMAAGDRAAKHGSGPSESGETEVQVRHLVWHRAVVVSGSEESAKLAASLVRGFLRLEMRTRRWERDAPTPASIGLKPADEISKLRDQALDVLVRCTNHASPTVGYAAAGSLRHWASGHQKLTAEQFQLWAPQLERESKRLVAFS